MGYRLPAFMLVMAACVCGAAQREQMAIWDFGLTAGQYTESPTSYSLVTSPILTLSIINKDSDGKDGTPFTDLKGVYHAQGQAAAWETNTPSTYWNVRMDTRGWSKIAVRFDYKRWLATATSVRLMYRVGNGPWVNAFTNTFSGTLSTFYPTSCNITNITAIEGQSAVDFCFTNIPGVSKFAFDNLEFSGERSCDIPTITLLTNAAASTAYLSGVANDPNDPVGTIGVDFLLADCTHPATSLTVTPTSSNTAVVPNSPSNLILSGTGATRNLKIRPAGRGYSDIILTVSDGALQSSIVLHYAGTLNDPVPSDFVYGVGISDPSTAVLIPGNFMFLGNNEKYINNDGLSSSGPQIFLYNRSASGGPLRSWDFSSNLQLAANSQLDIEASTRVGNRIFWLTSHGNQADGDYDLNRRRLFATDISGRGTNSQLTFAGFYRYLRDDLIAWDQANGHGKGANYYGFAAGAAAGNPAKTINGFNIEGFAMAPDGTTAYVGFRAPLVPPSLGGRALIVPIKNFATWFQPSVPGGEVLTRLTTASFGAPIELNLNGRSIRSIEGNAWGEYLINAGSYAGLEATGIEFQVYRWSGNPNDTEPLLLGDLQNPVPSRTIDPNIKPGGYEGIVDVPAPLNGSAISLILDNGSSLWYSNTDLENKTMRASLQRFACESMSVQTQGMALVRGVAGNDGSCALGEDGTVYVITHDPATLVAMNGNSLATKWTFPLQNAYPYTDVSPAIGNNGMVYAGVSYNVYAISNGVQRWAFSIGNRGVNVNGIAVGSDETVYVLARDNAGPMTTLFAITNGVQRWSYTFNGGDSGGVALGSNDVVYIASHNEDAVYKFNGQTGALIWRQVVPTLSESTTLTVGAGETIYVSGETSNVTAVNGSDGSTKWVFPTGDMTDGADVVLGSDGVVFAADDSGDLYAIKPDKSLLWSQWLGSAWWSQLTLSPDGTLYVASGGINKLFAYEARTGVLKWSIDIDELPYMSKPALSQNGLLYMNTRANTVSYFAGGGWNPTDYATALAAYAKSSWPAVRQSGLGGGRIVQVQTNSECVWKDTKTKILPGTALNVNLAVDEARGYQFTPLVNGTITALGGFFNGTKTVKLFNRSTSQLLAQVRVTDNNSWSYSPIPPVTVSSNVAYSVVVYLEGNGGSTVQDSVFPRTSPSGKVRIDGSTYVSTSSTPEAVPTNLITNALMYGQADIKFVPSN